MDIVGYTNYYVFGLCYYLSFLQSVLSQCSSSEVVEWSSGSSEVIKKEGLVLIFPTLADCQNECLQGDTLEGCVSIKHQSGSVLCHLYAERKSMLDNSEIMQSSQFMYYEWSCTTDNSWGQHTTPSTTASTSTEHTTTSLGSSTTTTETSTSKTTWSTTDKTSTSTIVSSTTTVMPSPYPSEWTAHVQVKFNRSYSIIGNNKEAWVSGAYPQIAEAADVSESRIQNVNLENEGTILLEFEVHPSNGEGQTVMEAVQTVERKVSNKEFFLHGPNNETLTANEEYFVWRNVTGTGTSSETKEQKSSSLFAIDTVYVVLIAAGILIVLLLITAIVAVCIAHNRTKAGKVEEAYANPDELNANYVPVKKENLYSPDMTSYDHSVDASDKYKLTIDVK